MAAFLVVVRNHLGGLNQVNAAARKSAPPKAKSVKKKAQTTYQSIYKPSFDMKDSLTTTKTYNDFRRQ